MALSPLPPNPESPITLIKTISLLPPKLSYQLRVISLYIIITEAYTTSYEEENVINQVPRVIKSTRKPSLFSPLLAILELIPSEHPPYESRREWGRNRGRETVGVGEKGRERGRERLFLQLLHAKQCSLKRLPYLLLTCSGSSSHPRTNHCG